MQEQTLWSCKGCKASLYPIGARNEVRSCEVEAYRRLKAIQNLFQTIRPKSRRCRLREVVHYDSDLSNFGISDKRSLTIGCGTGRFRRTVVISWFPKVWQLCLAKYLPRANSKEFSS